ncbi:hypothetical protein CV770_24195 [Bradyrhizobium sp. AC87j1]|uniref:acyltransferase family protein n=1 Tax=Bradyrhizobium sp. AC87j1 TaxID=2055894 RepID=UPI000CEBBC7E|nr:acyltransferase [Bradyrhizobium sp. AC87j1]PPQ16835.1 hypothetical protein CV770_24195 [Bradyrhizobium sp. AC87j1]
MAARSETAGYLDLLRAVAIVLVTNSHLDTLYPIPQLGTGGMFGNELFFFVSGFGLFLGFEKSNEKLGSWIRRRMRRIYEPLFIIATFFVLVGYIQITSISDFFWLYIVSMWFWFLPAIAACYLPIFYSMKSISTKSGYRALFASLGLAYLLIFVLFAKKTEWITENWHVQTAVTFPLRMIYYFAAMAAGVYAARYHRKISGRWSDLAWLVLSAATYYAFVAALGRIIPFELQIIDRIPAIAFLVFAYRSSRHPAVERLMTTPLKAVVTLIAGLSLQIYMVHGFILHLEPLQRIAFPGNLIVFVIGTLALAIAFEKIAFSAQGASTNPSRSNSDHKESRSPASTSVRDKATLRLHSAE